MMRLLSIVLAACTLLAVAAAAPAEAQRRGPPVVDRREAIKNKIRALRAVELQRELQLGEQELSRVLPILSKWDDVTDKLLVARADLRRRLAAVDLAADPRATNKLVDETADNQRAFWDLEDKRLRELRKVLTPAQVARLLIVLPAFERRIQRQLSKTARHGGPPGMVAPVGPPAPGSASGPAIDDAADDDDVQPDEPPPPRRRRR